MLMVRWEAKKYDDEERLGTYPGGLYIDVVIYRRMLR
jgi:hypothetical protein